jgi:hypothetical protein
LMTNVGCYVSMGANDDLVGAHHISGVIIDEGRFITVPPLLFQTPHLSLGRIQLHHAMADP